MKTLFTIVLAAIFTVIALTGFVFVRNNPTQHGVWLFTEFQPHSLGYWLLSAFMVGALAGLIAGFGLYRHLRHRFRLHQLQSRLQKLAEENSALRQKLATADRQDET